MKLLSTSDYYGTTIFCDDIRHEAGGKLTLIGTYLDKMFVHDDFPFLLPKFGMLINCTQRQRLAKPITKFLIFLPGDEDTATVEIPHHPEQMLGLIAEDDPIPEQAIIRAHASVVLSPVVFQKPGAIKVRAIRENEMIRCGALPVERAPTTQSS